VRVVSRESHRSPEDRLDLVRRGQGFANDALIDEALNLGQHAPGPCDRPLAITGGRLEHGAAKW
jgi:hypothetical protein